MLNSAIKTHIVLCRRMSCRSQNCVLKLTTILKDSDILSFLSRYILFKNRNGFVFILKLGKTYSLRLTVNNINTNLSTITSYMAHASRKG